MIEIANMAAWGSGENRMTANIKYIEAGSIFDFLYSDNTSILRLNNKGYFEYIWYSL